jgi:hypothetical protein
MVEQSIAGVRTRILRPQNKPVAMVVKSLSIRQESALTKLGDKYGVPRNESVQPVKEK